MAVVDPYMGRRHYNSSRTSRPKSRGVGRGSRRRSVPGWGTWFALWACCAVLLAAGWLGYRWWKQGRQPTPQVDLTRETAQARKVVTLCFSDEQAEFLVTETREVADRGSPSALAQAVVEELIRGPRSGLQPTIPPGTRLLGQVSCSQGTCTVDFSEEFVTRHPGGTSGEIMTVYSVVESLRASLPGVKAVQFLVEGKPRETLAGHLSLAFPVTSDPSLLRREPSQRP
jgi:germination protein M